VASQNADSNMAAGQAKQFQLNNPKCHTDAGPEISSRAKRMTCPKQNSERRILQSARIATSSNSVLTSLQEQFIPALIKQNS